MDAERVQQTVKSATRKIGKLREKLKANAGLEVLAAVAVGFLAGMVMRAVTRRE